LLSPGIGPQRPGDGLRDRLHAARVGGRTRAPGPRSRLDFLGRIGIIRAVCGCPGVRRAPFARQAGAVVPLPLVHVQKRDVQRTDLQRPGATAWSRRPGFYLSTWWGRQIRWSATPPPNHPQGFYTACAQGHAQEEPSCPQVVPRLVHRPAWADDVRVRMVTRAGSGRLPGSYRLFRRICGPGHPCGVALTRKCRTRAV
jgi:hypothetical protein